MYYLCSHENKYIAKDNRLDNTTCPICFPHSYIFPFFIRNKSVNCHPKNLSAMKRAGNNNAACKYRFRVCFSLYIR